MGVETGTLNMTHVTAPVKSGVEGNLYRVLAGTQADVDLTHTMWEHVVVWQPYLPVPTVEAMSATVSLHHGSL